jgi:hypothetical protein
MDTSTQLTEPSRTTPSRRLETFAVAWWALAALAALAAVVAAGTGGDALALTTDAGLLRGVNATTSTVVVAALATTGALVAGLMRWTTGISPPARRATLVAAGAVLLAQLALLDATVLSALGYLPAVLLTSIFNAEVRAKLDVYLEPELGFQLLLLVGAVLFAAATVRWARRTASACQRCGRRHDGHDPHWKTPAAAARWGRTAAIVAAVVPALYGVIRLAWAVGIPLGVTEVEMTSIRSESMLGAVGLGAFAIVGAVLTLGLFQRWGEVFPRWMLGLAGRRVPVGLAVVPATLVAVAVLPAAVSMIPIAFAHDLIGLGATTWGTAAPMLLWPLWSVALGAATFAYWLRRRGRCATCGRG